MAKKFKMQYSEKRSSRTFNIEAKYCTQRDKEYKQGLRGWNKGNGVLKVRTHPAHLPTPEKDKRSFNKGNHQQVKAKAKLIQGGGSCPSRQQSLTILGQVVLGLLRRT